MKMWQKMILLAIACVFSAAPAQGAWSLVDDFEGSALGPVTGQTADSGQPWNTASEDSRSPFWGQPSVPIFAVHELDGGQSLVVEGTGGLRDHAWVNLATPIAEGTVATLYCRAKSLEYPELTLCMNMNFGGFDGTGTGNDTKTTSFGIRNNTPDSSASPYIYAGGNVTGNSVNIQAEQWYEFWLVIDMTAELEGVPNPAGFFYNCYAAGPGLTGMVQLEASGVTDFTFRAYEAGNGITSFSLIQNYNNNYGSTFVEKEPIAFDDIYVDYTGANLISVPEPASLILLSLGSLVIWRKK